MSTRTEVWKGLSVRDGLIMLAVFILSVITAVVAVQRLELELMKAMVAACTFTALTGFILQRLPTNLSILDYIKISIRFHRSQKRYRYVHRR